MEEYINSEISDTDVWLLIFILLLFAFSCTAVCFYMVWQILKNDWKQEELDEEMKVNGYKHSYEDGSSNL